MTDITNKPTQKNRSSFRLGLIFCGLVLVFASATALHFASRSNDYKLMERHSVFLGEFLGEYSEKVLSSDFSKTEQTIVYRIDEAFEPVYQGINKVADVHYTIKGQYLELMAGYFKEKVNEIMLPGLNQRLEAADGMARAVYHNELADKTRAFIQKNNPGYFSSRRKVGKMMLDFIVEDAKVRFTTPSMITARSTSVGIAGTAGVYTYKKVVRILAKQATKRTAGTGSSIAGGASIGFAIGGPFGAVLGGGIAGVAAWIATDAVIIKIDEHLNRETFEAKLRAIVDTYKFEIQQAMLQQVKETNSKLARITPRDLISTRDNE